MKTGKRVLSIFLAVLMVVLSVPAASLMGVKDWLGGLALTASAAVFNGSCGKNLTWTADTKKGEIVISGTGKMDNYSSSNLPPWYGIRESLKSVTIDETVTSISPHAFYNFYSLTEIELPTGLTNIGEFLFCGCSKLTAITIPAGVTSIGKSAFANCSSLTEIELPDGLTSVAESLFNGCSKLTAVTIPDTVMSIGKSAFEYCYALAEIELPDGLTSIGESVFAHCSALEEIDLPSGLTSIPARLFSSCSVLTEITIPDGVTSIGEYAFSYCKGLAALTIPDSVTSIGADAFYYCSGLESVELSNSITKLSSYLFGYCSSLESIVIPDSITSIGSYAFYNCTALAEIMLSDNISSIGQYAFYNTAYYDNSSNWDNGVFYVGKVLLLAKTDLVSGKYEIRPGTTAVLDEAFINCSGLTQVVIPNSLKAIGVRAFNECTSLERIVIPNNVTSIGNSAFSYCSSLKSVNIPNSVSNMGTYVFSGCSNLTNVNIEKGITSIPSGMFNGCTSLTSIKLPQAITSIGNYAFYGCSSLLEVLIPKSVTSIGYSVFSGCTDLTIFGEEGSYAETFAKNCSIPFLNLSNYKNVLTVDFSAFGDVNPYADFYLRATALDGETVFRFVSTSLKVYMLDLDEEKEYRLELVAGNGIVFGAKDNVVVDMETVFFDHLLPRENITLTVQDAEGNTLTDGFAVKWYMTDGDKYIGGGSTVKDVTTGVDLYYVITLSEALQKTYVVPERQNITVGDNGEATYRLTEIPTGTISGIVQTADGAPISNAAVSVVQQISAKLSQNKTIKTDKDGAFSADVLAVPVTVSVSKSGYRPFSWSGNTSDLPEIVLQELTGDKLPLSITKTEAGAEEATPVYTSTNLDFTVSVNGTPVNDIIEQNLELVLPAETLTNGCAVEVTTHDRAGEYSDAVAMLTYAADDDNTVALNLVQKGSIAVTAASSANDSNMLLLFDADGAFVRAVSMPGVYVSSGVLEAGTYTALVAGESSMLRNVPRLALLDEFGLENGKDYYAASVTVADGAIAELTGFDVPKFDETKLYYTDPAQTSLRTTASSVSLGQRILLRAAYGFDDETAPKVAAPTLSVALPEGCNVVQGSVTLNGFATASYTVRDQLLTIAAGGASGVVRFYVYPTSVSEDVPLSFAASLSFKLDGEDVTQPIGSLQVKAKQMELSVPEKTAQKTNTITGKTLANATVELFDNDVLAGTAAANKAGSFSITFDLVKPYSYSVHEIYVKVTAEDGGTFVSQSKELIYDETFVVISKVTMTNTAHGPNSLTPVEYVCVFDFLNPSTEVPTYWHWPWQYPTFTFKAEFTNNDPEKVTDVYVVTTNGSGQKTYVPMTFSEELGYWIGTHDYNNGSDAPVSVSVDYESVDQQPFVTAEEINDHMAEIQNEEDDLDAEYAAICQELYAVGYTEEDLALEDEKPDMEYYMEMFSDAGMEISADSNDRDFSFDFGGYQVSLEMNNVDGLSEEMLLDDGYTKANAEGERGIYTKTEDGVSVFADLDRNIYWTLNYSEVQNSLKMLSKEMKAYLKNPAQRAEIDLMGTLNKISTFVRWVSKFIEELHVVPRKQQLRRELTEWVKRLLKTEAGTQLAYERTKEMKKTFRLLKSLSPLEKAIKACGVLNLIGAVMQVCDTVSFFMNVFNTIRSLKGECPEQESAINALDADAHALNNRIGTVILISVLGDLLSVMGMLGSALPTAGLSLLAGAGLIAIKVAADIGFAIYCSEETQKLRDRIEEIQKMCKEPDEPDPSNPNPDNSDSDDSNNRRRKSSSSQSAKSVLDPSGYVCEAVPSNRLEGVTTTCFFSPYEDGADAELWDASEYDQENPLTTDGNGYYEWFVPDGYWQVRYEKDGYVTGYSEWLPVPPPQTEVHYAMTSTAAPAVESVAAYPDSVEVRFSQYMDIASVSSKTVSVSLNGAPLTGSFYPLNAEASFANESVQYASVFKFVADMESPLSGEVTVEAENVRNYAATPTAESYSETVPVETKPETVAAEENVALEFGQSRELTVEIKPAEAGANKTLTVYSGSPSVVSVSGQSVTTDAKGKATVTITGELPGATAIVYSLDGTDLSGMTTVSVGNVIETCTPVTASIESGTTVDRGTTLTLSTTTPGASIYYTTDGSCPCIEDSDSRFLYTGPITLTENVRIIAYAVKEGYHDSGNTVLNYKVYAYGDANRDEKISLKDIVLLSQYLANYDYDTQTSTVEIGAGADANGDGFITMKDVILLSQFLANYDYNTETSTVVLGPANLNNS